MQPCARLEPRATFPGPPHRPRGQAPRQAVRRVSRPFAAAAPSPGNGSDGSSLQAVRPSGGRLARLLPWSSRLGASKLGSGSGSPAAATSTEAQEDGQQQQQVTAAALSSQQQPTSASDVPQSTAGEQQAAPPAARSGAFSLYSWLTWGTGASAAAPLDVVSSEADSSSSEAAELSDGMAAAAPAPTSGTSRRRSWYSLSRSSLSGSGSSDESAAGTESSAQRWQQQVPLDHPALQLLRQRALAGSAPGARKDPFKLGLVVEGGGMRGCVSGGALQALTDLGLRDTFDAVYGSSAGAINATFFLSGQRTGVDIYHRHIASPEFINLKRLWKGKGSSGSSASAGSMGSMDGEPTPVLNLSFLIDHVMHSVHPLDWDAVLASPVPLKVVASSLDSLNPILLDGFADKDDLVSCLKASATVPEIAGGPRLHRGHRLVDAAVFEPVPFRSAIADGCTHLLVLCTRPLPLQRRSRVNTALADAMEVAIKKAVLSPDYMVPAWKAEVEYLAKDGISQDDMLLRAAAEDDAHTLPWFAGTHVLPLFPGADASLSPLCIDPPTLRAGVAEGRRNVLAVCRELLGDSWDFSRFAELESSNIVPTRNSNSSSARLWRRMVVDDFSHHA